MNGVNFARVLFVMAFGGLLHESPPPKRRNRFSDRESFQWLPRETGRVRKSAPIRTRRPRRKNQRHV